MCMTFSSEENYGLTRIVLNLDSLQSIQTSNHLWLLATYDLLWEELREEPRKSWNPSIVLTNIVTLRRLYSTRQWHDFLHPFLCRKTTIGLCNTFLCHSKAASKKNVQMSASWQTVLWCKYCIREVNLHVQSTNTELTRADFLGTGWGRATEITCACLLVATISQPSLSQR